MGLKLLIFVEKTTKKIPWRHISRRKWQKKIVGQFSEEKRRKVSFSRKISDRSTISQKKKKCILHKNSPHWWYIHLALFAHGMSLLPQILIIVSSAIITREYNKYTRKVDRALVDYSTLTWHIIHHTLAIMQREIRLAFHDTITLSVRPIKP